MSEIVIDFNAARAARRVGYGRDKANNAGYRLMQRPTVRAAVERAREGRMERTGLSKERVLLEYARIALADLGRIATWDADGTMTLLPPEEMSDDDVAAIMELACDASGRVQARCHDKGFALEMLAQYFGLCDGAPPRAEEAGARELLLARLEKLAPRGP